MPRRLSGVRPGDEGRWKVTADQQVPMEAKAPANRTLAIPVTRLILAWVLTLAVLPYAWGRTLVYGMLAGWPESTYLGLLVVGLLAVIALTTGLSVELAPWRFRRWVGIGVAASWVVLTGVLIGMAAGSLIPKTYVVLLFVPATLWVVWAAWMFYQPLGWGVRLGILVLLLAAAAVFPRLIRAAGVTGDGQHIEFAWRWGATPREAAVVVPETGMPVRGIADLTRTTPDDFPQYLGPQRQAVLPGARLARDWAKTPPRLLWRQPVGAGWGAFAVVGEYAVTQEQRGDQECVVCYRVADGATAWIHADTTRFDSSMGGSGPRATPTIAGGRVYALGATGLLNCLDGATGRPIWAVNILNDNRAENIIHGVSASPLVVDNCVLVCPTGRNGPSLVAYHRDTGTRVWQAGQDQASYGSPLLAELAGLRQVLLATSAGVTAHDVTAGQVLWSFPWTNGEEINCSQPIPHAGGTDQVFFSTGYGKGCALFRVERSAEGAWSVHPLWDSLQMKTKFTTPVLHKGFVYGLDDGILACVDVAAGKRAWKDGRYQHGQILLAGDLLLVQAENGQVVLVEPVPDGLRELGRLPALTGKTWNNPALAGRFLLVRNDHEAACYELLLEKE
jgi:outer membrane protein assembly factor BamB